MRKVILYIAMSLDGYIADINGQVDWLEDATDSGYEGDYGYSEFYETIDTIIMGYSTYHQISTELFPDAWYYAGKQTYVLTHKQLADEEEIKFVDMTAKDLLDRLKREDGKHIWICGGANVAQQYMREDLIDEYQITIIPKILGDGIRLFAEQKDRLDLKLLSSREENGYIGCIYRR